MRVCGFDSCLGHQDNANVAQMVEQRIENPCVTGSNPVFGTRKEFRILTANKKNFLFGKKQKRILLYFTRLAQR
jgi:hypothetical protein